MSVEDTLNEREKVYGDFSAGTKLLASVAEEIESNYFAHHDHDMSSIDRVHIYYLLMKIVRLSVSPRHLDSWNDISGYSKRIHDSLKGGHYAQED